MGCAKSVENNCTVCTTLLSAGSEPLPYFWEIHDALRTWKMVPVIRTHRPIKTITAPMQQHASADACVEVFDFEPDRRVLDVAFGCGF